MRRLQLQLNYTPRFAIRKYDYAPARLTPRLGTLRAVRLAPLRVRRVLFALYNNSIRARRARVTRNCIALRGNYQTKLNKHFLRGPRRNAILRRLASIGLHVTQRGAIPLPRRLATTLQKRFVKVLLTKRPSDNGAALLHDVTQRLIQRHGVLSIVSRQQRLFTKGTPNRTLSILTKLPGKRTIRVTLHALSPRIVLLSRLKNLSRIATLRRNLFDKISFVTALRTTAPRRTAVHPRMGCLVRHNTIQILI